MPEWTIAQMDERMDSLKDDKEKIVLSACIKRKEGMTIAEMAKDQRRKPDAVRGWLARGRDRGLHDLADHAPPGRVPMLDQAKVEAIRGWLSGSPADFGYKRNRWQCGTVRERIRGKLNVSCSPDTVRRAMSSAGFSYRKSRPAPRKSASEEEQKGFKEKTGALLARLAVLGSVILALDEASCLVGGWNGYGWLPAGGRETSPMSWSKKAVRMIGVLGDGWFHIALVDSTNSDTLIKFLDKVRGERGRRARLGRRHGQRVVPQVPEDERLRERPEREVDAHIPPQVHAPAEPHRDAVAGPQARPGRRLL